MRYQNSNQVISRRKFLQKATAASLFTIVPCHILSLNGQTPPSEKLNIAGIGAGGQMCFNDLKNMASQNIVAVCDAMNDPEHWHPGAKAAYREIYPRAELYQDFRVLLEKCKDIDAVVIAVPDHNHSVIAMAAMNLGKHVFCEKPLTHSIYEARKLAQSAREKKLATQMGNNGHAGEWVRLFCEYVWDGAIGPVREVHAWTDRPLWPCELKRPTDKPVVPSYLDWDLWLGPARYRPYHPCYMPIVWRGWVDFGTGSLGDMGCHILDPVFMGLKLGHPTWVEAERTNMSVSAETYPAKSIIQFEFPARGDMPTLKLIWTDGAQKPVRPEELEPGQKLPENGVLCIGDKGKMLCEFAQPPRIIPESKMLEYKRPVKTLPRSKGHFVEWIEACKGRGPAPGSNFDYAAALTEMMLLGNVALRAQEKIFWDGPNMKVTNSRNLDHLVREEYRTGWSL
jgi:predicted dehydrogenase